MAAPPPGLDIMIVKPTNYDEIIEKSKKTPEPYTVADLERIYRRGLTANSAVFVAFITPALWED